MSSRIAGGNASRCKKFQPVELPIDVGGVLSYLKPPWPDEPADLTIHFFGQQFVELGVRIASRRAAMRASILRSAATNTSAQ